MAEVFQTGHMYGLDMLTTARIYAIIYSMRWYGIWSPGFVIQGHMPAFWQWQYSMLHKAIKSTRFVLIIALAT